MTSNMKIRTVAVLGAGAVGSYAIWGLSDQQEPLALYMENTNHPMTAKEYRQSGASIDQIFYAAGS